MSIWDAKPSKMMAFTTTLLNYVELPDVPVFRPDWDDSFSYGFWFKGIGAAGASGGRVFTNAGTNGTPDHRRGIEITRDFSTGHILVEFYNRDTSSLGIAVSTVATFVDSDLHFGLVTYNGNGLASGFTFYVDGVLEAKNSPVQDNLQSNTTVGTTPVTIGTNPTKPAGTRLYLRNCQWYDYVLTLADAVILYNRGKLSTPNFTLLSGARPYGYWPLESGAKDFGTGANHGTLVNFPVGTGHIRSAGPTQPQRALKLDGINQHGTSPHDASLTFATATPYTMVSWTAHDGSGSDGYIYSKFDGSLNGYGLFLGTTGKLTQFQNDDLTTNQRRTETSDAAAVPPDGKYHLVVASYDGSDSAAGNLFSVDTVASPSLVITNQALTAWGSTGLPTVGGRDGGAFMLKHQQTWTALYSGVLTSSEEKAIYAAGPFERSPDANRIASWHMDDEVDGVVPGTPNDLTLVNEPFLARGYRENYQPDFRLGDVVPGFLWDGGGVHLFDRLVACSISYWLYKDGDKRIFGHVTCWNNGAQGWLIGNSGSSPDKLIIRMEQSNPGNGLVCYADTEALVEDAWNHILVTKSSAGGRMADFACYINGVDAGLTTSPDGIDTFTAGLCQTGTNTFRIGGHALGPNGGPGHIKSVNMYNTTLTSDDAKTLYSFGPHENSSDYGAPASSYLLGLPAAEDIDIDTSGTDNLAAVGTPAYRTRVRR